jgi:TRAP transporter TAXI family solute receptor
MPFADRTRFKAIKIRDFSLVESLQGLTMSADCWRLYRRCSAQIKHRQQELPEENAMTNLTRRHFIGAAGAAAALVPGLPAFAQSKRITIGTNPAGSIYYSLGGGMAKVLTEKMGVQAIVQPLAGSSVALPLVNANELTSALSSTLDTGAAYRGDLEYQGKAMKNLRSLARIFSLPYTFTVRADSGIKTMADLKGKKVVMEFKALLGLKPMNEALVKAGGLQLSDITPISVGGLKQGLDAVADKTADASAVAAGIPMVQEMHASVPGGVRYLNVTGPNATDDFMAQQLPGSSLMKLEPNARMPEVTEPVTIGTYDVFLVVGKDLSDADANKMTTILVDSWAELQKDYPALRGSKLADLSRSSNVVPYHPGAIAAYKSKSMWTAKNDDNDKKVM